MSAIAGLCAVVLTHRNPIPSENIARVLGEIPHVVSTDNPLFSTHAHVYVEQPEFDRTEDRIGYHTLVAVNSTFRRFPWCSVVLLVEEDAELAPDFSRVMAEVTPWMVNGSYGCFTAMNWAWREKHDRWRPDRLRVVTGTFPEIVWAVSAELWSKLAARWGVRQYDSYIRAVYPELECLAPEVSRIRHIFSAEGTHRFTLRRRHENIAVYTGPPTPMLLSPRPAHQARRCKIHKDLRGTYNGNLPWCSVKRKSPPTPAKNRTPSLWKLAAKPGVSCNAVCGHLRCYPPAIRWLTFNQLVDRFPGGCRYYGVENGLDMPAVNPYGVCLMDRPWRFRCDRTHPLTRRLCPCVEIHEL